MAPVILVVVLGIGAAPESPPVAVVASENTSQASAPLHEAAFLAAVVGPGALGMILGGALVGALAGATLFSVPSVLWGLPAKDVLAEAALLGPQGAVLGAALAGGLTVLLTPVLFATVLLLPRPFAGEGRQRLQTWMSFMGVLTVLANGLQAFVAVGSLLVYGGIVVAISAAVSSIYAPAAAKEGPGGMMVLAAEFAFGVVGLGALFFPFIGLPLFLLFALPALPVFAVLPGVSAFTAPLLKQGVAALRAKTAEQR